MRHTSLRSLSRLCCLWTLCPKLNPRNEIKRIKYIFIWGRRAEYVPPGSPRAPRKDASGVPLRSAPGPARLATLAVPYAARVSP
jgi:hypothetical protein